MDLWAAISEYDVRCVIAFVSVPTFLLHFRHVEALVSDLRGWISQGYMAIAFDGQNLEESGLCFELLLAAR